MQSFVPVSQTFCGFVFYYRFYLALCSLGARGGLCCLKVTLYTVKKSIDFTVKYVGSGCQLFYRSFYGRLPVEHF